MLRAGRGPHVSTTPPGRRRGGDLCHSVPPESFPHETEGSSVVEFGQGLRLGVARASAAGGCRGRRTRDDVQRGGRAGRHAWRADGTGARSGGSGQAASQGSPAPVALFKRGVRAADAGRLRPGAGGGHPGFCLRRPPPRRHSQLSRTATGLHRHRGRVPSLGVALRHSRPRSDDDRVRAPGDADLRGSEATRPGVRRPELR